MNQDTNIGEYLYFSVYVDGVLTYTKYNFDFQTYKSDKGLTSNDKGEIFKHFLNLNGVDWTQPTVVKNELKSYFTPITNQIKDYFNKYGWVFHDNYMQTKRPLVSILFSDICKEQFKMKSYTDTQVRRLQDYFFTDDSNNYYTKYNFNFNLYQEDFKVTGSKLEVFTNFVIRCLYLSGTLLGSSGYGFYQPFSKYFNIDNQTVINYLINYGITSDYKNVTKNVNNINYQGYINNNEDLKALGFTVDQAKEHYVTFGQFETRVVPLNSTTTSDRELILQSVGSIFSVDKSGDIEIGTGFLYNNLDGSDDIYLITCYHLNQYSQNINTIIASFELVNPDDSSITSVTASFRIIGYDIYADILVGKYDATLDYNIVNNVDMTPFKTITVDFNYILKPGDTINCVGNLGFENNKSLTIGNIVDPQYTGNFYQFTLAIPDSILIEMNSTKGFSGAPLFVTDQNTKSLVCVGMMNGTFSDYKHYSLGINGFFFNIIVDKIIHTWDTYSSVYANDFVNLNYFVKNILTKRWLGIIGSYYNYILSTKNYESIKNFPLTGGLVVSEFILGYNYVKEEFITDIVELSGQGAFQINTPLVKTQMYKRFIESGKEPIIITSITFLDGIKSDFTKSYLGKYSIQVSYSKLMYGLAPIGSNTINGYTNTTINYYPSLIIDYYYYNGKNWVSETITVGGNSSDKYNTYTDPLGYKYYQHQFEFPYTLIPYIKPYLYETTGSSVRKTSSSFGTIGQTVRKTSSSFGTIGATARSSSRTMASY